MEKKHVSSDEMDIAPLEELVIASAKSSLDLERVMKMLDDGDDTALLLERNDLMYDDEDLKWPTTSKWQVASAAALVTGGASFAFLQNAYLSTCLVVFVFVTATLDDDSLSGALARIVGRSTLRSVRASQPKIKALARAVLVTTGAEVEEEIDGLKAKIKRLEEENAALRLWKDRRGKVDEALQRYKGPELKETARFYGLAVNGSKSELIMRLVEANVIQLE